MFTGELYWKIYLRGETRQEKEDKNDNDPAFMSYGQN
jgi:hypothetical protein